MVLTEKHHAVLFALLARESIQQFGPDAGEKVVREAVRRYGEQRGRRMAQRALRDGKPLTLTTYLQVGEWRSMTGEGRSQSQLQGEDLINRVEVCPWHNAWLEAELLPYGRLYCLEIDAALARGFNPEVRLDVYRTLSNEGEMCEFVYHQAVRPADKTLEARTVMGWDYHCAHLYFTCLGVFAEHFQDAGTEAARRSLEAFQGKFGADSIAGIQLFTGTDFEEA